jgi:hypothetical protein
MRTISSACYLLLVALFCSCDSLLSSLPDGSETFHPPEVYQQWWRITESCSGISGDFAHVKWYQVPGASQFDIGEGVAANGAWTRDGNKIIIAGDAALDGDLVRHEMLHALLRVSGHPRDAFIGHCDGTVVCTDQCIRDGGEAPPSDPSADTVSPAALEIGTTVVPSSPASTINGGNFMMVISAHNKFSTPVVVNLPNQSPSITYSFLIYNRFVSSQAITLGETPDATRFAPLETKHFIFDFHLSSGDTRYDLAPGSYTMIGQYGGVWGNALQVTVSP